MAAGTDNLELYLLLNYIQTHLKGKLCPSGIIKVGSFYEWTKNNFPDEFDFIFVLCCVEGTSDTVKDLKLYARKLSNYNHFTYTLFDKIEDIIEENKDIIQASFSNVCKNRKSKLHFNGYVEKKGPAALLSFSYKSDVLHSGRLISVDLVPAVRVLPADLPKDINKVCLLEPFGREIVLTNSLLVAGGRCSISETELRFIRKVLSDNHKKIYRILKFLINGNNDCEIPTYRVKGYSLYMIKTLTIHHHYECLNSDAKVIGPCILQVLDAMYQYRDTKSFPWLLNFPSCYKVYNFIPQHYIKSLSSHLRSLKCSQTVYNYIKDGIKKCVSKQYMYDSGWRTTEEKLGKLMYLR